MVRLVLVLIGGVTVATGVVAAWVAQPSGDRSAAEDTTEPVPAAVVSETVERTPILDTQPNATGPMPAEEAAAAFRVPEGFSVTVFASEPLVRNPLAGRFDDRGRLWVVENLTYAERPLQWDHTYKDRIVILSDTTGDGRADTRTVFAELDGPVMGLALGRGGVFVIAPPRLIFLPDRDRNDVPDEEPTTRLTGFTIPAENHHTVANGLTWGPDGWLYGRCGASSVGSVRRPDQTDDDAVPLYGGIWRYHPDRTVFEVLCHGTTNPWGLDWTADGDAVFVNTVNAHFWQVIDGAHYDRSHTISPNRFVYEPIAGHADHYHFDIGKGWTDSRDGDGTHDRLGGGHAHCGCLIVRNPTWPDAFQDRLLTINFHGKRINVERLEHEGSGLIARHEPDQFFAADPYFRGLDLIPGPDGAVYLLDWSDTGECHEHDGVHRNSGRVFRIAYHGDKPAWKTSSIHKKRTLDAPPTQFVQPVTIHGTPPEPRWLGGASSETPQTGPVAVSMERLTFFGFHGRPTLGTGATNEELRTSHALADPVYARAARKELLDRVADGRVSGLGAFSREGMLVLMNIDDDDTNLRDWETVSRQQEKELSWTLHAVVRASSTQPEMKLLFSDWSATLAKSVAELNEPKDQAKTVRWMVDDRLLDTVTGRIRATEPVDEVVASTLLGLAQNDPSPIVRLAVASALMRLPRADRLPIAGALLGHAEDANDRNLPYVIWYALIPSAIEAPDELAPLFASAAMPKVRRWIAQAVAEQSAEFPAALAVLLDEAANASTEHASGKRSSAETVARDRDLVVGLRAGLAGRAQVTPPDAWSVTQARLRGHGTTAPFTEADRAAVEELAIVFGDGRALDAVRAVARDGKADLTTRRAALETLIRANDPQLQAVATDLLGVKWLNTTAVSALTRFDDPAIGTAIVRRFRAFHASERAAVVTALASRPSLARALLEAVEAGTIDPSAITAADARQIAALGDEAVTARLEAIWGRFRSSSADRAEAIAAWQEKLTPERLAVADIAQGRATFDRACATCHKLHGRGEAIGPDLTGADRGNLFYLLSNIVDPSAVVTNDYRVTVFALDDGRIVSGIVARRTPQAVTVQTPTERLTIPADAIEQERLSDQSLMPDGLLTPLSEDEATALIAYLMRP